MTDMKRNWIFGTLGIVVLMSAMLAIARGGSHPNNNNVEEQPLEEVITSTEPQDEILDNNNDFACNLFRTINKHRRGSIVVSPISVSYLLGILNQGADGKTRQQITDLHRGWRIGWCFHQLRKGQQEQGSGSSIPLCG